MLVAQISATVLVAEVVEIVGSESQRTTTPRFKKPERLPIFATIQRARGVGTPGAAERGHKSTTHDNFN
jgi:hypothetical protein